MSERVNSNHDFLGLAEYLTNSEQPPVPTTTPTGDHRRDQYRWFNLFFPNHPPGMPGAIRQSRSIRSGGASEPSFSSILHEPVPELSQPTPSPSSVAPLDVLSIMAFRRLQRYRAHRRNIRRFMAVYERSHVARENTAPAPPADGEDAEQNDAEDNESEQSENGGEIAEEDNAQFQSLSPQLPPQAEEPPDNNSVVEVEGTPAGSPGQEAGDAEDSEDDAAATTSTTNATTQSDRGEASRMFNINLLNRTIRGYNRKRESQRQQSESFDLKEFNQNLLRLLECPVCLDWMEPPMQQCRLGHLVCARCRSRLSACPVCRSGFSSVRNRAMESVAELLRYPCRHGCGCEMRLRRRALHEASCAARRYRCPACASQLPYEELVQHVQRAHAEMIKMGRVQTFSVTVSAQQHDLWLVVGCGALFLVRVDVDVRASWSVMLSVAYIGPEYRANEFTYEVSVKGQHNSRKLVYLRAVHSEFESRSLTASKQDCFYMTLDEAINFLRTRDHSYQQDRLLDLNVYISRQDASAH